MPIVANIIVQLMFWFAVIIGLISGHPWVTKKIDEKGTEHWEIFLGPFGLSLFILVAAAVFKYLCS